MLRPAGFWLGVRACVTSAPCPRPDSCGERANAQLKSWRIVRKLLCCPWRAGQLAKAIHVLQTREIGG
jgi:hypothetical protein